MTDPVWLVWYSDISDRDNKLFVIYDSLLQYLESNWSVIYPTDRFQHPLTGISMNKEGNSMTYT